MKKSVSMLLILGLAASLLACASKEEETVTSESEAGATETEEAAMANEAPTGFELPEATEGTEIAIETEGTESTEAGAGSGTGTTGASGQSAGATSSAATTAAAGPELYKFDTSTETYWAFHYYDDTILDFAGTEDDYYLFDKDWVDAVNAMDKYVRQYYTDLHSGEFYNVPDNYRTVENENCWVDEDISYDLYVSGACYLAVNYTDADLQQQTVSSFTVNGRTYSFKTPVTISQCYVKCIKTTGGAYEYYSNPPWTGDTLVVHDEGGYNIYVYYNIDKDSDQIYDVQCQVRAIADARFPEGYRDTDEEVHASSTGTIYKYGIAPLE